MVAQDSRVNLGALGKGRGPSNALNSLMKTEAPFLLGKNLYVAAMHFPTWSIRADGPSRERKVDPPRTALPAWFWLLRRGDLSACALIDDCEGLPRAFNRWFLLVGMVLLRNSCDCSKTPSSSAQRPRIDCPRSGDRANPVHPKRFADATDRLASRTSAGGNLGGIGSSSHRSFVRILGRIYDSHVRVRAQSSVGCGNPQCGDPAVWLGEILSCSAFCAHGKTSNLCPIIPQFHGRYCMRVWLLLYPGSGNGLAILLLLGFYALLRPSELIMLRRRDISIPGDHLETGVLCIRIGLPKTRNQAARNQRVRMDEANVVMWVTQTLTLVPMWSRIWSGSLSSFKLRFDHIQRHFLQSKPFLPSSLRPGGATYLFRLWDENLPRLQWRGRWRSFRVLEIYVQELGAAEVWIRFPPKIRAKVFLLGSLFSQLMDASRLPADGAECSSK